MSPNLAKERDLLRLQIATFFPDPFRNQSSLIQQQKMKLFPLLNLPHPEMRLVTIIFQCVPLAINRNHF